MRRKTGRVSTRLWARNTGGDRALSARNAAVFGEEEERRPSGGRAVTLSERAGAISAYLLDEHPGDVLAVSPPGYALFEAGDMDEIGQTGRLCRTPSCVRRPAFPSSTSPACGVSCAARRDRTRARCRRASAESIARRRPRSGQTSARRSAPRDPPRVVAQNCWVKAAVSGRRLALFPRIPNHHSLTLSPPPRAT